MAGLELELHDANSERERLRAQLAAVTPAAARRLAAAVAAWEC